MNSKELSELLEGGEQPTTDYKSKWYDIASTNSDTKERQRGEMIKDIVALANGNVTSAAIATIAPADRRTGFSRSAQ